MINLTLFKSLREILSSVGKWTQISVQMVLYFFLVICSLLRIIHITTGVTFFFLESHEFLFFFICSFFRGQTINRPKLCSNATWNTAATTFANNSLVGTAPFGLFVSTNNTVYVPNRQQGRLVVWENGNSLAPRNLSSSLSTPYAVFVTDSGDVYIDNAATNRRVEKLAVNTSTYEVALFVCTECRDITVDVMNNLYCVVFDQHKIVSISLTTRRNLWNMIAGTGTAGNTTDTLNNPQGVFVDRNLDFYVGDCGNDRVQKYRYGQRNGTTIVFTGPAASIALNCPSGITMDADGYLYIVDNANHRIIGEGPAGFRCIVACNGAGSTAIGLNSPTLARFDTFGNLFVTDQNNNRIQIFTLLTNECGECLYN